MPTFDRSPAELINTLTELLRDRYPAQHVGDIFKELSQNADDAGAARCEFVILDEGLADAENPLLRGPAVLCVNDGAFREQDEIGIRTLSGASKADEPKAIGRFGLGQKSIFHLCEAWFYLGRDAAGGHLRADVINPWARPGGRGDPAFPDWDLFSENDRARVTAAVLTLRGDKGFLVLWVPLRSDRHRRGSAGIVLQDRFETVDTLESGLASFAADLATWFAHLCSLTSVVVSRATSPASLTTRCTVADVRANPEGSRLGRPHGGIADGLRRLSTRIAANGATLTATGIEVITAANALIDLAHRPEWPRRYRDVGGAPMGLPEKAVPQGAVTVVRAPAGPGTARVTLRWAVFLPVELESHDSIGLGESGHRWDVLLHGYFFPDSGRRGIPWFKDEVGADGVRRQWNSGIRDLVTLPQFLPAIHQALDGLEDGGQLALVKGIAELSTYRAHAATIARDRSLVWAFDGESTAPTLMPSSCRLLALPPWGGTVPRAARALARAARSGVSITRNDLPRLRYPDASDAWEPEDLEHVDTHALVEALRDSAERLFLRDFLAAQGLHRPPALACVTWLRQAVQFYGAGALARPAAAQDWSDLVERCPKDRVVFISGADAAIDLLSGVASQALIAPSALRPENWPESADALTPAETRDMLLVLGRDAATRLNQPDPKGILDQIGRVAAALIQATSPSIDLAGDAELKVLPLFRVWSARQRQKTGDAFTVMSLEELSRTRDADLAFQQKGMARHEDVAGRLLDALVGPSDVVLTPIEVGASLAIPELKPDSISALLRRRDTLLSRDPEKRARLLERLLESTPPDSWPDKSVLRLLIHGHGAYRHSEDKLLLAPGRVDLEPATIAAVVAVAAEAWRWRLVTGAPFETILTAASTRTLGVDDLHAPDLVDLLRTAADLSALALLPDEERLRLLRVAGLDPDVWRRLPLHRTTDGRLVAADGRAFLESDDWPVPARLGHLVDEIERSAHAEDRRAQENILEAWGRVPQAAICLSQPEPHRYARLILDTLPDSTERCGTLLRETRWLPASFGPIAPEYLLDLPPAVVGAAPPGLLGAGAFCTIGDVADEVRAHPACRQVVPLLALRDTDAVDALATELGAAPDLVDRGFSVAPPDALPALPAALDVNVGLDSPGWQLLRALHLWRAESDAAQLIGKALCRPWSVAEFVRTLSQLALAHESTAAEGPWQVYRHYFRVLCGQHPTLIRPVLQAVRVRSDEGTWSDAHKLAPEGEQLAPGCLLHRELAAHFLASEPQPAAPSTTPTRVPSLGNGPSDLRSYFVGWEDVSREAIGVLLAVLGNSPGVPALAQEYLGPLALDDCRDTLNHQLNRVEANPLSISPCRHSVHVAFSLADTVQADNLIGGRFDASLKRSDEAAHLVLNDRDLRLLGRSQPLTLRVLPRDVPAARRVQLLRATLDLFVLRVLGATWRPSFEEQWARYSSAGQVSVDAVRGRILHHLPAHLDTLGCREHARLFEALRKLERAFLAEADAKDAHLGRREETAARRADAERELYLLVEEDLDVQRFLLGRIRHKLTQYQYNAGRVLFELLQNADDAVLQLHGLWAADGVPLPDTARVFSVERLDADRIVVQHWGRPINRFSSPAGQVDEGRRRGYDLDLLHMMLLNVSDKEATPASTGRFGLGFKAVHLVSRAVRIKSGLISCEVTAGFLPKAVPLPSPQHGEVPPTRFELDLEPGVAPDEVVDGPLEHTIGILPVLTQQIRDIRIDAEAVSWDDQPVAEIAGLRAGRGTLARGGPPITWLRFAVPEARQGPVPAVVLGAEGWRVRGLEKVPTLWCTVPTGEPLSTGYVVNGAFDLDVGRSRLAASSGDNLALAERIGTMLAEALRTLASCIEADQAPVVLALPPTGPARTAAVTEFWTSMWKVLSCGLTEREPHPIVISLHADKRGLGGLATHARIIPTGLPAPWDGLTDMGAIRGRAHPLLEQEGVITALNSVHRVRQAWPGGSLVSGRVADTLRAVGSPLLEVKPHQVFEAAVASHRIDASLACDLGPAMTVLVAIPGMDQAVTPWLAKLEFLAADNTWTGPHQLLLPPVAEAVMVDLARVTSREREDLADEAKRGAFGPPGRMLNPAYARSADALAFVLAARERLKVGHVTEMEQWAHGAVADRREAVLRYVATGLLGRDLGARLRNGALAWLPSLAQLTSPPWTDVLAKEDLAVVASVLFPSGAGDALLGLPIPVATPRADPREVLSGIARWWSRVDVRAKHLKKWHEAHYPVGWGPTQLERALREFDDPGHDQAWMILLTLGACQAIGRTRPSQHRAFIDWMANKGNPRWWTVICDPACSADSWGALLGQWADLGEQERAFDWWGGQLPVMCQLRRWLEPYRRILQAADTILRRGASIEQLWIPRANAILQGTDLEGPPMTRFRGQGGNWVLRELARLNVITGDVAHPHCYPPRKALRDLLGSLGFFGTTSPDVYRFLLGHLAGGQVTFSGDFDIPLTLVALNGDLREAAFDGALAEELVVTEVEEELEEDTDAI